MTFKQFQKKHPDALKLTLTSKTYITIADARNMLYGKGEFAKLLDTDHRGDTYTFIFSQQALIEEVMNNG